MMKKKGLKITSNAPSTVDPNSFSMKDGAVVLKNANLEVKKEGIVHTKTGEMKLIDSNELQLIKLIGGGACGQVQLALHKSTNNVVAIKYINILDKDKRHQLVHDLKVLFTAHSPYLITCFGGFYIEGNVGIVLEIMDLGSLGHLIAQSFLLNMKIPEPIIANIILKILKGLAFLHIKMKTIHRDLKPGNILVNRKGEVKLTDFGISKELIATANLSSTFVGTSAYMSPERIENSGYTYNSDIWSVGIIVIEMITGKNPYPLDASPVDLIDWIIQKPSPTLTPQMGCSSELINFTALCLDKNKATRKQTTEFINHPWFSCAAKEENYISWLQIVGKGINILPT